MNITIDGQEYPLRYSLRALKKFEQKSKLSVFNLGDANALSAEACAWLIYCGIVDGCAFDDIEFKMTLAEIEPYCDLSHVELAVQALQQYTGAGEKKT